MSRLFLSTREINFFADIGKELIKDVNGQVIYLYPINEIKTTNDEVYNEAIKKVFDNPIKIDCLVDVHFQNDTKVDKFGVDAQLQIEAYVQWRDLVDKGIKISIGDVFSFSDTFYEVSDAIFMRTIYGLPEHKDGLKVTGVKCRETQFDALIQGPTDYSYSDPSAVQTTFYQQRGQAVNGDGVTGDKRELQNENIVGQPITGVKEVSPKGDDDDSGTSAFYDDE